MKFNIRKAGIDFWNWNFDNSIYISVICSVLLGIIDISNVDDLKIDIFGVTDFQIGKLVYYIVILLAFVCGIFASHNAKEIDSLEAQNKKKSQDISDLESTVSEQVVAYSDLFNSYLKLLLNTLDFEHSERISVYKVKDNLFSLIGRTSHNPMLMRNGRKNYPIDEGFIAKGWAEERYFIDSLPDPSSKGGNLYYKAINEIMPINRETVDNIKMKSRTFFILRLNGYNGEPNAVIVFESLNATAFTEDTIMGELESIRRPLEMFIEKNINQHAKSINLAENSGF